MKKDIQLLKGGIFDKPFMQSRIKTHSMTFMEKLLGYFLGPSGVIIFAAAITQLRELYYTSVVPIDNIFGTGTYLVITTIASIVGVASGLLISWMMEHTYCKSGRVRPYLFLSELLMILSGVGLFVCPFATGSMGQLIWLGVTNVLYLGVASNCYAIRYNKIPLGTRNLSDRASLTTIYNAADNIISGLIVGLLISSVLYYQLLVNDTTGENWRMIINVCAVLAVPLTLLEYWYTRERVTEENMDAMKKSDGSHEQVPIGKQLKILLTNKYYLLALAITVAGIVCTYLAGTNCRTNYCQWVLGANAENNLQMIYMAVAMAPMGFGVLLIFPLVKRFGARMVVLVGSLITAVFGFICMAVPTNIGVAFGGSFVYTFGLLTLTYLQQTFMQQACDIIEYKHGFRPESSLAYGIIVAVYNAILAPLSGLYETVLVANGYDAYAASQPAAVVNWIVFVWFGIVALRGLITFLALIPFDAGKIINSVQAELKERRKQAVLARGEEWIDEEELERLAKEESERKAEEDRIADLRERCSKKGLNFDSENAKYLAKKAKKDAKAAKKAESMKKRV